MARSVSRLISILFRHSRIYLNQALRPFDISSAEFPFLLSLYHEDGKTQDDLSSYLLVDKAATARAIKTLEEKSYIRRSKDADDKRCNRVYLTKKARLNETEIKRLIYNWTELLTEDIDPETVDIVYEALQEMVTKAGQINQRS